MIDGLCDSWAGEGQVAFLDTDGEQFFWLGVRKNSETRGKQLEDTVMPNFGNTKENS